jgi:hypothetical protein
VNRRADCRQVAKLSAPDLRRYGADSGDGFKDEAADRSGRGNGRRAGADEVAQPVLDLLLAVGDQLFFSREIVVDRLLGDFGQTSKWQGDQLIAIFAFWNSALQAKQIGLG